MKTTLKSTLAALSVALLVSFTSSGCKSSHPGSGTGTHNMGVGPKASSPMDDEDMPGRPLR
ncbi:hypothetical protein [Prosthecobacter sp.]|uniref:hypothetical protein n=1 Tax=Prosthecobacter sp. TaxID=1965333 RepID=UPI002ABB7C95|nr:hypothetical protein [Prosthecobacter sp.]MDZ4405553.1 hypothetical protein [Prosthecobacter sp.]